MSYQPDRFGSNESAHFTEAYEKRVFLNALVVWLFVFVWIFSIFGLVLVFSGAFLKAAAAFGLTVVFFSAWTTLHNWALAHPKRQKTTRGRKIKLAGR